jgi:hypothetical protein
MQLLGISSSHFLDVGRAGWLLHSSLAPLNPQHACLAAPDSTELGSAAHLQVGSSPQARPALSLRYWLAHCLAPGTASALAPSAPGGWCTPCSPGLTVG